MNKKQFCKNIVMVGMIFCLLQGCGKDKEIETEEATKLETTIQIETTTQMETKEYQIESYEKVNYLSLLDLEKEEDVVLIYDIEENHILFHISYDYKAGEEGFREEGYASYTKRLVVVDTEKNCISREIMLDPSYLCTDAIFLEGEIICVYLIKNQDPVSYQYQIVRYQGDTSEVIKSESCYPYENSVPWLARLGNQNFAYSYYSYQTGEFGVNIVNKENQITPSLSLLLCDESDKEETLPLSMVLTENKSEYMLYAAVNGKGVVFIGDEEKVEQFEIPSRERVYQLCFVGENICAMMEVIDEKDLTSTYSVMLKDRKGNNLVEKRVWDILYVLGSDFHQNVLGMTYSGQPYLIHCDKDITVKKQENLPYPSEWKLFYSIGESEFYVFYMNRLELYKVVIR